MPEEIENAPRSHPLRLGVLVSGRGTNLQAIIDAIAERNLDAEIVLVASNYAWAGAVRRAETAGVPCAVFELKEYPSRLAQQSAIFESLGRANVDLVVCAGWDRILKPEIVDRFAGRIINVHPSLLPAFGGGLNAVEEALLHGVKVTGCTVHFVTNAVDEGPIISQAAVPVFPGDTVEILSERIHAEEHRLLVEAIRLFAEGRLAVNGRIVTVGQSAATPD